MKAKTRISIVYFLKELLKSMEFDKAKEVNPVFLTVFSIKELRAILQWLFDWNVFQPFEIQNLTKEELLEAIGDEKYILMYIMEQWKEEQEQMILDCNYAVLRICKQVGLDTHYLAEKPFVSWDDFDKKNFNDLVAKAGALIPKYGIFDASVQEEGTYNLPNFVKRYDSEWEAHVIISLLVAEGKFKEGELKVMQM